jgi:PPIC-type peptidyl-prolyl cis-trans isomerase-like protein
MRLSKFALSSLLFSVLVSTCLHAQDDPLQRGKAKAHRRGAETPILVPPGPNRPSDSAQAEAAKPTAASPLGGNPAFQRGIEDRLTATAKLDPKQPRPLNPRARKPFVLDRPILQVNEQTIQTEELNELVVYYQGFKQEVVDLHLQAAVKALLPKVVIRGLFQDQLPQMRKRILAAQATIRSGQPWAEVAAEFSDDYDEENPEGTYHMARERAVQPFDRLAHSGHVGQLVGPFLTVYGFHLLEITGYQQGPEAKDDQSTVRHILVMYPGLKKLDDQGQDLRSFIKAQVKAAKIEALEPGSANLVPIDHRQTP